MRCSGLESSTTRSYACHRRPDGRTSEGPRGRLVGLQLVELHEVELLDDLPIGLHFDLCLPVGSVVVEAAAVVAPRIVAAAVVPARVVALALRGLVPAPAAAPAVPRVSSAPPVAAGPSPTAASATPLLSPPAEPLLGLRSMSTRLNVESSVASYLYWNSKFCAFSSRGRSRHRWYRLLCACREVRRAAQPVALAERRERNVGVLDG